MVRFYIELCNNYNRLLMHKSKRQETDGCLLPWLYIEGEIKVSENKNNFYSKNLEVCP